MREDTYLEKNGVFCQQTDLFYLTSATQNLKKT